MTKMRKKSVWQFRISAWLWMVLVVATFFFGRSWDATWGPLWRQTLDRVTDVNSAPESLMVTIPGVGPVPVTMDRAQPVQNSQRGEQQQFSFFVGFSR